MTTSQIKLSWEEEYPPFPTFVARDTFLYRGKTVVVSTINRRSSSYLGGWYAETLVFTQDEYGSLCDILDQAEASPGSISSHDEMVEKWKDK